MKLQQLRFLLAVVDNDLNITAASERLFTSQPGVSKQIRILEEELGVAIFERKGRSLTGISETGHEVIAEARQVMSHIDRIKTITETHRTEEQRVLSIATTHTQARYVLPPIISAFKKRHPNVNLNLHQGTSEQIVELSRRNEIDFAIASGYDGLFDELLLLPCYRWDRVVLVPVDHPLARLKAPLTLEELAKYPLVTYVHSFGRKSSLNQAFADRKLVPNVVFTARDADVIKTYVRLELGVGIVASMAWDAEQDSDLVVIDAEKLFPRSVTWIGFRQGTTMRRFMLDFLQLVSHGLERDAIDQIAKATQQSEIDALIKDVKVPVLEPSALPYQDAGR